MLFPNWKASLDLLHEAELQMVWYPSVNAEKISSMMLNVLLHNDTYYV